MKVLDKCLQNYERNRDRVLIFSYSTASLDFIQEFVKERGYSHLRLDGSTPTKKRQPLIDEFQKNDKIFLFLISTKAGGLGVNLTAANRVIIYDVNWNPSYDEQAQDRAFRIGQLKDVDVLRLVARGTIEELKYCRQVYKVHLNQKTLEGSDEYKPEPARLFRGVDGDKNRKGELFGCENLLRFKDGSFMEDLWKSSGSDENRNNHMHDESELITFMQGKEEYIENGFVDEDEAMVESIEREIAGIKEFNHEDFLREDRGAGVLNSDGHEVIGESQIHYEAYESACRNINLEEVEKCKQEEIDLLDKVQQSLLVEQHSDDDSSMDDASRILDRDETLESPEGQRNRNPSARSSRQEEAFKSNSKPHESTAPVSLFMKNCIAVPHEEEAPKSKSIRISKMEKSLFTNKDLPRNRVSAASILYRPAYLHSTKK